MPLRYLRNNCFSGLTQAWPTVCSLYGAYLLKNLAKKLEPEYGSGFSVRQLERSRQFYKMYPIASALRSQFNWTQIETVRRLAENPNGECVGEILWPFHGIPEIIFILAIGNNPCCEFFLRIQFPPSVTPGEAKNFVCIHPYVGCKIYVKLRRKYPFKTT